MTINEKVSYLKGLIVGLKIDDSTSEGKIINVISDILEEIASEITDLKDETSELSDYVDELDDDLASIEDDFYECDGCCEEDDEDEDEDNDDEDDFGEFFEVKCPSCGETVVLDDSIDPSRVICPACHCEFSDTVDK
ncbi:hypothetical protein SDC9_89379 [bioreactor metagenome]|uniref:TFIIB-type domain-containing protein n=1 Tax=bioreactor metagenome TaxID=1076179 RepID=A0A644ZP42_9ZZZZ|nr:hypothetical protein [Oscillospiraceae bacterium]